MAGVGAALALLFFAGNPPRVAYAADSIVNPGESIQAAINAASPGDTIIIMPGTYTESLTLNKAVSLTGVSTGTTIIRAVSGQRVITITGATITNSTVISGLTFTGGVVTSTTACPESCGGGLLITGTAQPLFQNVIISDNQAYRGGGLYAFGAMTLIGGVFQNDRCTGFPCSGGGAYFGGAATVTDATFISNMASGGFGSFGGGGAYCSGAATMAGTTFLSNTTNTGSGGGAYAAGAATLTGGVFQNNTATGISGFGGGGAIPHAGINCAFANC
jgi:hypothetical protein